MELKVSASSLKKYLYLIMMIWYLFAKYISFTSNESLRNNILSLSNIAILGFITIFTIVDIVQSNKITINQIVVFLFFIIELFYSIIFSTFSIDYILILFLAVNYLFSYKDKKIIKNILDIKIIFVVLAVILSHLGILNDIQNVKLDGIGHSYGFIHANSLAMFFLAIVIDITILSKRNLKNSIFLFIIVFLQYKITLSRTSLLISLSALVVFLGKPYLTKKYLKESYKYLSIIGIWILGILLPYIYNGENALLSKLSDLLSGRLYLGNYYIQHYPLSWFPQVFNRLQYSRFWDYIEYYNDNFYLDFLLKNGVLLSLLLAILILFLLKNIKLSVFHGILLIGCFLFLFIENQGINPFLMTPFIFEFIADNNKGELL